MTQDSGAATGAVPGIGTADLLAMYEQMEVIRRTERAAHDLFLAGLVKGTTHLAAGHEAVAVGASAALRPDDYVFATYRVTTTRSPAAASPLECLAELMSRGTGTGLCQAKGGSMHLTKAANGLRYMTGGQVTRWGPAFGLSRFTAAKSVPG